LDPDHPPAEFELIEASRCDILRRFDAMGIQCYGFHALPYTYLME
jgi:hypothetical protein